MRTRGLVVALGLSLFGARHADAVKLIVKMPTIVTVDAPPHPTLVVRRQALRRIDPTNLDGTRHFPFTVTPIDDYWVRITVDVGAGTTFRDSGVGSHIHYRVVRNPAAVTRDVVDAATQLKDDARYWNLVVQGADHRAWTRIDWAYDPTDIDRGLFGSAYPDYYGHIQWPSVMDADRVFLRVTTYRMNGVVETSRMWLSRDGEDVEIHDGVGEAAPVPAMHCIADSPRPVPVDPTFSVDISETPRYRALAIDGRVLATTFSPGSNGKYNLDVAAPEGTTFMLQRLPVVSGCPRDRFLRATRDRSHDEPPVLRRRAAGSCDGRVQIADPDTWGAFEVQTAGAERFERQVSPISDDARSIEPFARTFVTVTPLWGDARGTPWTGWLAKADYCAAIDVEPATAIAATPSHPIAIDIPGTAAAHVTPARHRGFPVRPVLVVILLLALVPIRPTIRAC